MKDYNLKLAKWERRRLAIDKLRRRGWTLERIGRRYGISRQRVWAVLRS